MADVSSSTPGLIIDDDPGSAAAAPYGTDLISATSGEAFGAAAGSAFASSPGTRLARRIYRNVGDQGATLSPEEANQRYGIQGKLSWSEPVSEAVAQDVHDHQQAEIARQDVLARSDSGLASVAGSVAGSLLDPLGVAASFIPFVGEARVAAIIGEAGASALGRGVVRGLAGAGSGLVGTAPLVGLNAFLAPGDHDDYTMGQGLAELAFGAALGGFGHVAGGILSDKFRGVPEWVGANERRAAMQQAASAMIEGRPVDAEAAVNWQASQGVRSQLEQFYQAQQRFTQDAERALDATAPAESKLAAARTRLQQLQNDMQGIEADLRAARSNFTADAGDSEAAYTSKLAAAGLDSRGFDTATLDRLAAVTDELSGTIPASRRADLEAERTLLMQNRDAAPLTLEQARSQAEIQGLTAAQERQQSAINRQQATLDAAERQVQQKNGALAVSSAALNSRESTVAALTERMVRRVAGALGTPLEDGEAAALASQILRSKPEQASQAINDVLDTVAKRATLNKVRGGAAEPAFGIAMDDRIGPIIQRTRDTIDSVEAGARDRLLTSARNRNTDATADPAQAAALQAAAPKVEGDVAKQVAELQRANDAIEKGVVAEEARRAKAAGREPGQSADVNSLQSIKEQEGMLTRAMDAYAACMIGGA